MTAAKNDPDDNKSGSSMRRFLRASVSLALYLAVPSIGGYADTAQAINWQSPRQENGISVITGTVQAPFGAFELRWAREPNGAARLISLQPGGSAEAPLMEKSVFILNDRDGDTTLLEEWFPLLNQKGPARLNKIAVVDTASLFSVVAGSDSPPAFAIDGTVRSVRWGARSIADGVAYRKGLVKAGSKTIGIAWRIAPEEAPELSLLEDSRISAPKGVGTRLFLWIDSSAQNAVLLQAEPWRIPVLKPVVVVSSESLLSGLR